MEPPVRGCDISNLTETAGTWKFTSRVKTNARNGRLFGAFFLVRVCSAARHTARAVCSHEDSPPLRLVGGWMECVFWSRRFAKRPMIRG